MDKFWGFVPSIEFVTDIQDEGLDLEAEVDFLENLGDLGLADVLFPGFLVCELQRLPGVEFGFFLNVDVIRGDQIFD